MERWPRRPPDPIRKTGTRAVDSFWEAEATGAPKEPPSRRDLVPGGELGRSAGVECEPGASLSGGSRADEVAEVRGRDRSGAV